MQSCEHCHRALPPDAPSCPECGPQPSLAESAPRAAARAPRALLPPAVTEGGARRPRDLDGLVASVGGNTATAAKIEPKTDPFGDERTTGSRRRPSGAWAKGGGEGAKIIALHPDQEDPAGSAPLDPSEPISTATEPPQSAPAAERTEHGRQVSVRPPPDATSSGIQATTANLRVDGASEALRKPPVLASESLRADLAPNVPGRGRIRIVAIMIGGLGAAAVVGVAGFEPASWAVGAGLALVAALGVARLSYRERAAALLAVALPSVCATSIFAAPHGGPPHGVLLALTASGLAGALYFRAKYRASRLARGLVAAGVAVGVLWLLSSGVWDNLTAITSAWQSWLPTLLGASLAFVLALALLGFMTSNTTGGCTTWATTLLVWLGLYEGAVHAAALFPAAGPGLPGSWRLELAMGAVATPLLATVAAIAIAQLLVVASGGGREEPSAV